MHPRNLQEKRFRKLLDEADQHGFLEELLTKPDRENGGTGLVLSCMHINEVAVSILVEYGDRYYSKSGAKLNSVQLIRRDMDKRRTPLNWVTRRTSDKSLRIAEMLLEYGERVSYKGNRLNEKQLLLRDEDKRGPLHHAWEGKNGRAMVELLLEYGAKMEGVNGGQLTAEGWCQETPLDNAINNLHQEHFNNEQGYSIVPACKLLTSEFGRHHDPETWATLENQWNQNGRLNPSVFRDEKTKHAAALFMFTQYSDKGIAKKFPLSGSRLVESSRHMRHHIQGIKNSGASVEVGS